MKFKKILMLGYGEGDLEQEYWERVNRLSEEKVLLPKDSPDIPTRLATADCLLVKLGAAVDKETMDNAPNLKYIGMYGTGYGRIDAEYAASKGIIVCNISDYATQDVAEFAFAVILAHIRELERARQQAHNGDYSEATFEGSELRGKFFGIIGLGNIGSRIADIACVGFGAEVGYWSRTKKPDYDGRKIHYHKVDSLIKKSDYLSLNLALVPETENFLDAGRIAMIKPGAVVLNLAPMELVNIDALEKRLTKKDITFILDHSDELSPEDAVRLSKLSSCIMYPPVAYTTKEATLRKQGIFVGNLENFLRGLPTNKVN